MTWRGKGRRIVIGARRSSGHVVHGLNQDHVHFYTSYNGSDFANVAEAEASDQDDATIARVDRVSTVHDQTKRTWRF